jgi:hypothetical protein
MTFEPIKGGGSFLVPPETEINPGLPGIREVGDQPAVPHQVGKTRLGEKQLVTFPGGRNAPALGRTDEQRLLGIDPPTLGFPPGLGGNFGWEIGRFHPPDPWFRSVGDPGQVESEADEQDIAQVASTGDSHRQPVGGKVPGGKVRRPEPGPGVRGREGSNPHRIGGGSEEFRKLPNDMGDPVQGVFFLVQDGSAISDQARSFERDLAGG